MPVAAPAHLARLHTQCCLAKPITSTAAALHPTQVETSLLRLSEQQVALEGVAATAGQWVHAGPQRAPAPPPWIAVQANADTAALAHHPQRPCPHCAPARPPARRLWGSWGRSGWMLC